MGTFECCIGEISCITMLAIAHKFIGCIKKDNKQYSELADVNNVHCSVPLNILVPKLTLKISKELANLHDIYMPSRILKKDALILLEKHDCNTCPDILAVFRPYKAVSNAEYQQTWFRIIRVIVPNIINGVLQTLNIKS